MAGKKGMKQSRPTTQVERDKIALARIENWMDEIQEGHVTCVKCRKQFEAKELQPSAVALIKARYDKLRPSLSAVEQTTIEVSRSAEEIVNEIRALVAAKPELVASLFPGKVLIDASSTVVAPQQMVPDAGANTDPHLKSLNQCADSDRLT